MSSSYIHLFWSFQTYDSEWIHHIIWFDHCTLRMSTSWIIINSKDPKWVHCVMYSDHFRLRLKTISFFICSDYLRLMIQNELFISDYLRLRMSSSYIHLFWFSRLMTQNEFIIPLAFEEKQMSLAPKEEYVDPREKIREAIPTLEHSVSIRPNLDDASRYKINCMAVLIEKCIICLTNTVFLSAFSTLIVIQVSSLQKKILKNTRTSKCFV